MADAVTPERLTDLLGFLVHDVRQEPVASGGQHSHIFACASEIGDLVLRICKGRQGFYTDYFPDLVDPERWMDQWWATSRAREAGVPAPEIIWSDRRLRWVAMRRLPGVPIDGEYETWHGCPYDEREFGGILRRLHGVTPAGYGPIDDDGRALFPSWPAFLVAAARSAMATAVARKALPAAVAVALEDRWLPCLEALDLARPSLLHMESLGFANILYDPATRAITGLLDYEDCTGGDPLFEFAWMRYYFEHDGADQRYFDFARFEEGYGPIDRHDARTELYAPFPLLDKLRWIEPKGDRAREYRRRLEETVARA